MAARDGGFTLIELVIVIVIVGIFLTMIIDAYKTYQIDQKQRQTLEAAQEASNAISQYHSDRDRYPCPAGLFLGPEDPLYGEEICGGPKNAAGDCACASPAAGTCTVEGVCAVEGRDVDGDGTNEKVLIGAFPFVNITRQFVSIPPAPGFYDFGNIPERHTYDAWRHKFTYAVTEVLTASSSFDDQSGAVEVRDEFGNTLLGTPGSAHFVFVSHGENGVGAYNVNGVLVAPCNDPPVNPEDENCNYTSDAVFVNALRSTGTANYYDDLMSYELWQTITLWAVSPSDPKNIYNLNPGNVGMGVTNPQEKLDVNGDLQTETLISKRICDQTGDDENCFPASKLGGKGNPDDENDPVNEENGMYCFDRNEAMVDIANGKPVCRNILPVALPAGSHVCPAGAYMRGFTLGGGIVCSEP